jgi:phosphate transport system substrate-binding protein
VRAYGFTLRTRVPTDPPAAMSDRPPPPARPAPSPLARRQLLAALPAWLAGVPLAVQARSGTEVLIGGTGAGLALAARIFEGRTGVRVVSNLGTGGGLKALAAGAIDIALAARPLNEAERGARLVERDWLRSPFVWAAHPEVPVSGLTLDELAALYDGRTAKWRNGLPVRLVLRPENDSDTAFMRSLGPALSQALSAAHARPGTHVAVTDMEAIEALARMPGGVGITTLGLVRTMGATLKVLNLGGVRPDLDTLTDGRWPHAKTVTAVTRSDAAPATAAVLDAMFAAPAAAVLASAGCQPARRP